MRLGVVISVMPEPSEQKDRDSAKSNGSPPDARKAAAAVEAPYRSVEAAPDKGARQVGRGLPENLPTAIEDAYKLVTFAASQGLTLKEEDVRAVLNAREALKTAELDVNAELGFWAAYRALSAAVQPVSVGSIQATNPLYGRDVRTLVFFGPWRRVSEARFAARRYSWFVAITLAIALILQVWWLIGTGALNQVELVELTLEKLTAEGKAGSQDISDLMDQLSAANVLLADFTLFDSLLLNALGGAEKATQLTSAVGSLLMRNQLSVIELFFMPILYGLLGAGTFVIRRISDEISKTAYDPEHLVIYNLRILLGGLAGLSAAWFLPVNVADATLAAGADPDTVNQITQDFLNAVGPWAAAFAAGYSVELLFAAMDRFVGAFAGGDRAGTRPVVKD